MTDFTDVSETQALTDIRDELAELSAHTDDPTNSGDMNESPLARANIAPSDFVVEGSDPAVLENVETVAFEEAAEGVGEITHVVAHDETDPRLICTLVDSNGDPGPVEITENDILRFSDGRLRFEVN